MTIWLSRLKSASVDWVKFGIESASQEVLDNVSRYSIYEDEERKNIQILKNHKIKSKCNGTLSANHSILMKLQKKQLNTQSTLKQT